MRSREELEQEIIQASTEIPSTRVDLFKLVELELLMDIRDALCSPVREIHGSHEAFDKLGLDICHDETCNISGLHSIHDEV